jgi:hypothetical protein
LAAGVPVIVHGPDERHGYLLGDPIGDHVLKPWGSCFSGEKRFGQSLALELRFMNAVAR